MSDEAVRFRARAEEYRNLAARARSAVDRGELLKIAQDLEAEADKIDAEQAIERPPMRPMQI